MVGPGFMKQKKGIVEGYSVEQLILDLLVWLPGINMDKELLESHVETAKGGDS